MPYPVITDPKKARYIVVNKETGQIYDEKSLAEANISLKAIPPEVEVYYVKDRKDPQKPNKPFDKKTIRKPSPTDYVDIINQCKTIKEIEEKHQGRFDTVKLTEFKNFQFSKIIERNSQGRITEVLDENILNKYKNIPSHQLYAAVKKDGLDLATTMTLREAKKDKNKKISKEAKETKQSTQKNPSATRRKTQPIPDKFYLATEDMKQYYPEDDFPESVDKNNFPIRINGKGIMRRTGANRSAAYRSRQKQSSVVPTKRPRSKSKNKLRTYYEKPDGKFITSRQADRQLKDTDQFKEVKRGKTRKNSLTESDKLLAKKREGKRQKRKDFLRNHSNYLNHSNHSDDEESQDDDKNQPAKKKIKVTSPSTDIATSASSSTSTTVMMASPPVEKDMAVVLREEAIRQAKQDLIRVSTSPSPTLEDDKTIRSNAPCMHGSNSNGFYLNFTSLNLTAAELLKINSYLEIYKTYFRNNLLSAKKVAQEGEKYGKDCALNIDESTLPSEDHRYWTSIKKQYSPEDFQIYYAACQNAFSLEREKIAEHTRVYANDRAKRYVFDTLRSKPFVCPIKDPTMVLDSFVTNALKIKKGIILTHFVRKVFIACYLRFFNSFCQDIAEKAGRKQGERMGCLSCCIPFQDDLFHKSKKTLQENAEQCFASFYQYSYLPAFEKGFAEARKKCLSSMETKRNNPVEEKYQEQYGLSKSCVFVSQQSDQISRDFKNILGIEYKAQSDQAERVEHKNPPKLVIEYIPAIGQRGLFTLEPIAKDTIICCYRGETDYIPDNLSFDYSVMLDDQPFVGKPTTVKLTHINGAYASNEGAFVNHAPAKNASCELQREGANAYIVAKKNIPAGSQISFDYGRKVIPEGCITLLPLSPKWIVDLAKKDAFYRCRTIEDPVFAQFKKNLKGKPFQPYYDQMYKKNFDLGRMEAANIVPEIASAQAEKYFKALVNGKKEIVMPNDDWIISSIPDNHWSGFLKEKYEGHESEFKKVYLTLYKMKFKKAHEQHQKPLPPISMASMIVAQRTRAGLLAQPTGAALSSSSQAVTVTRSSIHDMKNK